jgi:hypothetical protein
MNPPHEIEKGKVQGKKGKFPYLGPISTQNGFPNQDIWLGF